MMKRFTLTMMGLLMLLGGVSIQAQTPLLISGGFNNEITKTDADGYAAEVQLKDHPTNTTDIGRSCVGGAHWADTFSDGDTHTFTVTLADDDNTNFELHIAAVTEVISDQYKAYTFADHSYINTGSQKELILNVTHNYAAVYIYTTNNSFPPKVKIKSITRNTGGGGGSALAGKTNVPIAIPYTGQVAMYTYTFDNGDYISKNGFDSSSNPGYDSSDDSYSVPYNLWLHNDNFKGNSYDSQLYINLDKSQWPTGTKAILHFAVKSSDGFECEENSKGMEIALQRNSDPWTVCGEFTDGIIPTNTWTVYDLETTVTDAADCEKLYINCGMFKGNFRFDDIILYKETNFESGGSNLFTTSDQVANIASSAFSSLNEGDYIYADITGTPSVIKLTCNGNDYALTQFNSSNLWGIKVTSAMVTALKTHNSEFKGYPLTLNSIDIYKTVALGEGDNSTALASKINNVFVELTRSFAANTWNTVCLPFVPSEEQAAELFGSGYKLAKFTASGASSMTFTTFDLAEFEAGKPYLVRPTTTVTHTNKVLANVDITETEGSKEVVDGYKFKGSFEPTTFSSNLSLYRFIAAGNELMTPTEGSTLKSLRCYFEYPSGGGARSFTIDEEATGIHAVNGSGLMVNGYYNLNGQRVAQPTKGLYIMNGKKVVIK